MIAADTARRRCSTCNSPDPMRHPAVQLEGEVQVCRDRFHPLTEHTITDEEIHGLLRSRALHLSPLIRRTIVGVAVGDGATYTINGVPMTQAEARARCAEILNARAKEQK